MSRFVRHTVVGLLLCVVCAGAFFWRQASEASAYAAQIPDDFAFRLAYGVGAKNVIDTYAGILTKDLITAGTMSTGLQITPKALHGFYTRLVDMDVTGYPRAFDYNQAVGCTPYMTYQLRVRMLGTEMEVCLETEHPTADPRAATLLSFVEDVRRSVESTRAYRRLPAAVGGYD